MAPSPYNTEYDSSDEEEDYWTLPIKTPSSTLLATRTPQARPMPSKAQPASIKPFDPKGRMQGDGLGKPPKKVPRIYPSVPASPTRSGSSRQEPPTGYSPMRHALTGLSLAPGSPSPAKPRPPAKPLPSRKPLKFDPPPVVDAPIEISSDEDDLVELSSESSISSISTSSFGGKRQYLEAKKTETIHTARPVPASSRSSSSTPSSSTLFSDSGSQPFLWELFHDMELESYIISHDKGLQQLLDDHRIAWGVQLEIHRGLQANKWAVDDVSSKIKLLEGPNESVMHRVSRIILGTSLQLPKDSLLPKEFDREQTALLENKGRGLGLMGHFMGEEDWYGGKIQQIVRLDRTLDQKSFTLQIEPLEMRRSTRLARFLTSRRILHIRIGQDLLRKARKEIIEFLQRKFVLGGRVFVPIPPKDDAMYLVEVTENYERRSQTWAGDQFRMSFGEFLQWHNPLELNAAQPMVKYHTRFALALSTSVPALEFKEENIHFIEDIYTSDWKGPGKAPAEKTLTDGCGLINEFALIAICRKYAYEQRPSAVQGRIAGSKGLWALHPTNTDQEPHIWIRDSQKKISYPDLHDRVHRIFDLVHSALPPPTTSTYHLSMQSLMNLSFNGVPHEVFVEMMRVGLEADVRPLMQWTTPEDRYLLWNTIDELGKVHRARMARISAGLAKALGFSGRDWGNPLAAQEAQTTDESDVVEAAYTGRNEYSGAPYSMYESVVELIQAGFHPKETGLLLGKLRKIVTDTINDAVQEFRIPIPEGKCVEAFVMVDPLGILKEDEVFFRSSKGIPNEETMFPFHVVTGEVLIGRYPIRLPSDIQKLKAVDCPDLYRWSDVVVVPAVGCNIYGVGGLLSLMSGLSGGDADGDKVFLIWYELLLRHFKRKALYLPPLQSQGKEKETLRQDPEVIQEEFKKENFERRVEKVAEFKARLQTMPRSEAQTEFQRLLLGGFTDGKVGMYSYYHDAACWRFGMDSPQAIRFAYMSNTLLDASKTGLRLRADVSERDSKAHRGRPLDMDPVNGVNLGRCHPRGPYVLSVLLNAGKKLSTKLLQRYDEVAGGKDRETLLPRDPELLAPYREYNDMLDVRPQAAISEELAMMKDRVDSCQRLLHQLMGEKNKRTPNPRAPSKKRKRGVKETREDPMLAVSRLYQEPMPEMECLRFSYRTLMASYAYSLTSSDRFGFMVAFRDLCDIKSKGRDEGFIPCRREFDLLKRIPASTKRAFARTWESESSS